MGLISLILPTVGVADKTEDPKINTCLTTIATVINGNIEPSNMAAWLGTTAERALPGNTKVAEAPQAAVGQFKLQAGSASFTSGELGTGVSTQQITLPAAWGTLHIAFLTEIVGVVDSSKILKRAGGVTSTSQGFVIPDMGGTTQGLLVRWLSIGY